MIDIISKMFAYLCLENYNQVCISEENIDKYFKVFYKILVDNIDNVELISLLIWMIMMKVKNNFKKY